MRNSVKSEKPMRSCGRQKLMDYVNHHNARRDNGLRFRKGEGNDGE